MDIKHGSFIISLDFEMMWGAIFNDSVKAGYQHRTPYVKKIIPELLRLFKKYNMHATWAIVGGIACSNKEEALLYASSSVKDPYSEQSLKDFIRRIPENCADLYFNKNLVNAIAMTKGQEIGTHTFSHFYYFEHGTPQIKLKDELVSSCNVLNTFEMVNVKTLVLPKNQVSEDIYSSMHEMGLSIIRGIQRNKRFNKTSKFLKYLRFIDAYIPICGDASYEYSEIFHDGIFDCRASRFWRTYLSKLSFLEPLKIYRIKRELTFAAKHNRVYHLWFHPHNLSSDYEKNLKQLEKLLIHFKKLENKYGMQSLNMCECASYVKELVMKSQI